MNILNNIAVAIVAFTVAVMDMPSSLAAEAGVAVRFIEGCEADFDGDNVNDIALLFEGSSGVELTVLLKRNSGYKGLVLYKGKESNLRLSCRYVKTVKSTVAGKENIEGTIHVINGLAVGLAQPESSGRIFYWKNGAFVQVWFAD
jgi:DNA polymerase III alpha subunit